MSEPKYPPPQHTPNTPTPDIDPIFLAAHLAQDNNPADATRRAHELADLVQAVQDHWGGTIATTETTRPEVLALALATRVDRKTPAELIDYARCASQTLGTAYAEQLKTQPAPPTPTVITAQRATDTPATEDRQQPATAQPPGRPQSNLAEWTQQLTAPTHDPNDAVWATFTGEHPTTPTDSPFIDRNENRQIRQVGPLHVVTGLFAPALLLMANQAETGIVYAITGLAGIIWAALAAYLVTRHRQPAT